MKSLFKLFAFAALVGFMAVSCAPEVEGEKVETGDAKKVDEEKAAEAKTLAVDAAASTVNWEGSKIGGKHTGTIAIKEGSVEVKGDEIVGGTFVFDMGNMTVTDEGMDDETKAKLVGHLSSGDFFEIEKFPTATFTITNVTAEEGEGTTHRIEGNLKMRDTEKSISFAAKVDMAEGSLTAEAPQFVINRQDWGIDWQNPMKESALSDDMGISLSISAK
jgi:polyisoprenoid-binding protein YceI